MTQSINIQIPGQSLAVPLPKLLALLAIEEPVVTLAGLPAAIGADLQGGIYVGPMVEDGQLVHTLPHADLIGKDREFSIAWSPDSHIVNEAESGPTSFTGVERSFTSAEPASGPRS